MSDTNTDCSCSSDNVTSKCGTSFYFATPKADLCNLEVDREVEEAVELTEVACPCDENVVIVETDW